MSGGRALRLAAAGAATSGGGDAGMQFFTTRRVDLGRSSKAAGLGAFLGLLGSKVSRSSPNRPTPRGGPGDLAAQARVARDDLAAATGSRHATVTGAYDVRTGKVVSGHSGRGFCAETHCVRQLVEKGSKPGDIRFVEAIRPRTGLEVPVCTRCQGTYQPGQFPPTIRRDTPGPWDDL